MYVRENLYKCNVNAIYVWRHCHILCLMINNFPPFCQHYTILAYAVVLIIVVTCEIYSIVVINIVVQ